MAKVEVYVYGGPHDGVQEIPGTLDCQAILALGYTGLDGKLYQATYYRRRVTIYGETYEAWLWDRFMAQSPPPAYIRDAVLFANSVSLTPKGA